MLGGLFEVITNYGKQKKMLFASQILQDRLNLIYQIKITKFKPIIDEICGDPSSIVLKYICGCEFILKIEYTL